MGSHGSRLPLALMVAAVAAGAATFLLRPRSGLIDPAAVDVTAYFSPAEIDRAEDFRGLQRALGLAGLGVSGATLGLLALRPPRRMRRLLERAGKRPVAGSAAAAAGLSIVLVAVDLPLAVWRHERAVDYGLSTQSIGPWLGDLAKSSAIGAILAGVGGAVAVGLIRRAPRRWPLPAAGVVVGFAVLTLYLSPVVVDPVFNDFDPLPNGKLRSQVLTLADRAGVDVGDVYRVDASRRTTTINAYVGGLGHTKRVVLYDNLIDDYPEDQVLSVVAHELGHVEGRDIPRGILWVALVAPAGMFLLQQLALVFFRRGRWAGDGWAGPAAIPALALALALVSFGLGCAGNALSRRVEARADAFALELTRDPRAFVELERSLATRNLGDPDPPKILHVLLGTHPTTKERIGYGEAFR